MAPPPGSWRGAGRPTRAASARARARYKYPLSTLWIFENQPPYPPTHPVMLSGLLSVVDSRLDPGGAQKTYQTTSPALGAGHRRPPTHHTALSAAEEAAISSACIVLAAVMV
jgi:hypothetical protein